MSVLSNSAVCWALIFSTLQVVRELQNYKSNFRVLALSATPGDNLETVQSVLSNLLIAHVEVSIKAAELEKYAQNVVAELRMAITWPIDPSFRG